MLQNYFWNSFFFNFYRYQSYCALDCYSGCPGLWTQTRVSTDTVSSRGLKTLCKFERCKIFAKILHKSKKKLHNFLHILQNFLQIRLQKFLQIFLQKFLQIFLHIILQIFFTFMQVPMQDGIIIDIYILGTYIGTYTQVPTYIPTYVQNV